jgi:hypothetical protein
MQNRSSEHIPLGCVTDWGFSRVVTRHTYDTPTETKDLAPRHFFVLI